MKKATQEAPASEQVICITCGFCCDGTIFSTASLEPGEKGNLPEKIEETYFVQDDKEFFKQPCLYFSSNCTIYNQKKAIVCSAYRCQLLKDLAAQRISKQQALKIVERALAMRHDLFVDYTTLTGANEKLHFKKLLEKLWMIKATLPENEKLNLDYEMLIARCNIFEALLIKHFRSAKDFESMRANEEGKRL